MDNGSNNITTSHSLRYSDRYLHPRLS